ncbi:ATP-binding protein [Polyangium sp. 15x6]|uniref:ATP-binding protein n=1 Tax=Polyangium sp. 15x6 TaxID=3042687 RepID=UPI00249A3FD9|nr:ATP-binding protein [Polyangium sp. 15x6]MDI3282502.1 ATP-binding protein [Polyangium sp. 15x6]
MTEVYAGRLSDLLLVRVHGRSAAYLAASRTARPGIVEACRREATVPDLAERILSRTIYAQSASRIAPLRELVQNALDASPRGSAIDVQSGLGGTEIIVTDRGRGMTADEVLGDLLVPFRSGKEGEELAIGEHGIGFFSALEIAPRLEVKTRTRTEGHLLRVEPLGKGPPYADFAWSLRPLPHVEGWTGTSVRLLLDEPISRSVLASEVAAAASFVDPAVARIYVDGVLINVARTRMRRVARAHVGGALTGPLGELSIWVGRGDGALPHVTITQRGLLVAVRQDLFTAPELSLHRDLARAIVSAGFGIVVELPAEVPLNKGRSAVAAHASAAVESALIAAFERFVLHDALYDRELLRAVDHRLSSVLDRLLCAALAGQPTQPATASAPEELTEATRSSKPWPLITPPSSVPPESERRPQKRPTVAAPEEVVRFADALLDTPAIRVITIDDEHEQHPRVVTLRHLLGAYRAGTLRPMGEPLMAGRTYVSLDDPLADALWRRLVATSAAAAAASSQDRRGRRIGALAMQRIDRETLLVTAKDVPGVDALAAAMTVLEGIDAAISIAAELTPSPISVHQDLYGPDEMAHTDGSGISVNLASARVRALLVSVLQQDDPAAFGALVDLMLHEKTHVSLASYVPHANAEHGASFYRRKDLLRRRLLESMARGIVGDPASWLPAARRGLSSVALPAPDVLAATFQSVPSVAA